MADSIQLLGRTHLRAAFFNLLNTSADDEALGEHYADATEAANVYIQRGLESAQAFVIDFGDPSYWLVRSQPLTWSKDEVTGTVVSADLGWWATLLSDFLRLAGDEHHSALLDADGRPWGRQIDPRDRHEYRGAEAYYLGRYGRLYLVPETSPPANASMEYYRRVLPLTSDDYLTTAGAPDFQPVADRWIIVAFAADHAIYDSWPAGGAEMERKIRQNLAYWKEEMIRRWRRTRQPRRLRRPRHIGPNMIAAWR
jgi:hypothetical protein